MSQRVHVGPQPGSKMVAMDLLPVSKDGYVVNDPRFPWNGDSQPATLRIVGVRPNGEWMSTKFIEMPWAGIDALIEALEYLKAGPIGRMALDRARERNTTGVE